MIVNGVLGLVTKPQANSDVGTHPPVVLEIGFDVIVVDCGIRRTGSL